MTLNTDAADTLRKAAEVVQEKGLCKGSYESLGGRVCMWGAINTVLSGNANLLDEASPIYQSIRNVIGSKIFDGWDTNKGAVLPGAVAFNDKLDTTVEDVAKFLLKTADEVEVL